MTSETNALPPREPAPPQSAPGASVPAPQSAGARSQRALAGSRQRGRVRMGLVIGVIALLLACLAAALIFVFIARPMLEKHGAQDTPQTISAQDSSVQQDAATQTVDALGKELRITNPQGYCTLGKSKREIEVRDKAASIYHGNARLLHLAYRCSELSDYNKGLTNVMNHKMIVVLLVPEGKSQPINASRKDFLAAVADSSPQASPDQTHRNPNRSQGGKDDRASDTKLEQLGRDENAVYFSMKKPVSLVYAITLVKGLPLQIYVLDADGAPQSQAQLKEVLEEPVKRLIQEN